MNKLQLSQQTQKLQLQQIIVNAVIFTFPLILENFKGCKNKLSSNDFRLLIYCNGHYQSEPKQSKSKRDKYLLNKIYLMCKKCTIEVRLLKTGFSRKI